MSALKQSLYRLVAAAWNSPVALPGADRGDSVSIVCLHGVHSPAMERIAPPPTSSVSAASFAANMRMLRRYYRIVSLADAVAMLDGRRPWQPRSAVLTFDDSLKCTADVAFPILEQLGMTATVFVSTDALHHQTRYWWLRLDHAFHCATVPRAEISLAERGSLTLIRGDLRSLRKMKAALRQTPAPARDAAVAAIEEQFGVTLRDARTQYPYADTMSWSDVQRVLDRGFSVGSHTVTHPNLAILDPVEVRHELERSKRDIETHTGIECRHFCYPYGAFNDAVAETARHCGYEAATSTVAPGRNRPGQPLYALRRYAVPAAAAKLPYLLTGFPEVVSAAKATLRRQRQQPALSGAAA